MATNAERAARFAAIIAGYEAEGPDSSVPGAASVTPDEHPRWVLVEQHGDHGYYFVNLANGRSRAEALAAEGVHNSSWPVCIFDLDELAGEPSLPDEITVDGVEWMVHEREFEAGRETGRWVLKRSPDDRRRRSYDWLTVDPVSDASRIDLGGWEDERMPVRYLLARVQTLVVFNTTPEAP